MAIIVIGLGVLMVIPFHIVVREKNTVLKKLKWYRWLLKPDFYLVSMAVYHALHVYTTLCACALYKTPSAKELYSVVTLILFITVTVGYVCICCCQNLCHLFSAVPSLLLS